MSVVAGMSNAGALVGSGFNPFTDTKVAGNTTLTIPTGASQVVINLFGPTAGGQRSTSISSFDAGGSGGGARVRITRAILPGEWGTNLTLSLPVGTAGSITGGASAAACSGPATCTGTLNGGAISLSAGAGTPGAFGGFGSGGTASGGDVNTNGSNGTLGDSVANSGNGGASGGGFAGGVGTATRGSGSGGGFQVGGNGTTNGGAGTDARLTADWT